MRRGQYEDLLNELERWKGILNKHSIDVLQRETITKAEEAGFMVMKIFNSYSVRPKLMYDTTSTTAPRIYS